MTDFVEIQTELFRTAELAIALHLGECQVRLEEGGKLVRLFPNMRGVVIRCDGTLLESGKWGAKIEGVEETPSEECPLTERLAWHSERVAREGEDTPPFHAPREVAYAPLASRGCTKKRPCPICKENGGKKPPKMSKKEWAEHFAKMFAPQK